jgi:hypothetical protein
MKEAVKRIVRDEKGRAMELVLILLTVGGLVMTPLLGLVSTGLLAGEVYEMKTDELYAADAGVEDAAWKIQNQVAEVQGLSPCYPAWSYNIADVNGKSLNVTITYVTNMTYRVDSIATGNNSGTRIEAYITGESVYGDYGDIMNYVLTSPGEINVAKKVIVDPPEPYPVDEHGVYEDYPNPWPQVWELEAFYGGQVEDARQCSGSTVLNLKGKTCPTGPIYINDVAFSGPSELEPLYVDGPLQILNSINPPVTLSLNGTVYATGDTLIGSTGKEFTLDLNGQTIFVSSDSMGSHKALVLGGQCTIKGPGIIIAVGDIEFKPKAQAGEAEGGGPIFVLSVLGTTTLTPSGEIYGAIAGAIEVYVQQGEEPTITYPPAGFDGEGLNFLIGIVELAYGIVTWEVSGA